MWDSFEGRKMQIACFDESLGTLVEVKMLFRNWLELWKRLLCHQNQDGSELILSTVNVCVVAIVGNELYSDSWRFFNARASARLMRFVCPERYVRELAFPRIKILSFLEYFVCVFVAFRKWFNVQWNFLSFVKNLSHFFHFHKFSSFVSILREIQNYL